MTEGQWYYTQNGQQVGPVSFYQLQQLANGGTVKSTDYVWTQGQADWKPADQIAGLFSGSGPAPPPPANAYPGGHGDPDLVMPTDPPRDPTLMAILSLVVPGLGQIVLGQTVKGIVLLVLGCGLFYTTCVGGIAVSVIAIIDAYQVAIKLQSGRPVRQWEFF